MIATGGSLKRGIRNVLRNPVRLVLVVVLLGASLTFTAAMLALNSSAQNQIAKVRQQVGTSVSVTPANSFGFQVFGTISNKQVDAAKTVAHVAAISELVQDRYNGSNLYGTAKIPKQFQQFGFQRFGGSASRQGPGSGFGGFGQGSGRSGGPSFRRRLINGGKGKTIEPTVTGITGAASGITLSTGTVKLISGRDLSASDADSHVALMTIALAKANKLHIGSTFKLDGTATKLVGEYTVTGASTGAFGQSFAGNSLVVPVKLAEKVFNLTGITSLTVYVDTANNVNSVVKALQSKLGSSVTVASTNQSYAATFSALNSTSNNIQAALVAALITAAVVIVFAVFIIVRERTREIGVLKAIGASSVNIVTQFTTEVLGLTVTSAALGAVLLGLFGGAIAKMFSVTPVQASTSPFGGFRGGGFTPGGGFSGTPSFFSRRFQDATTTLHTTPLNAGLSVDSLLFLLAVAVGLAVLASWIPTWYVSRLQPARVLSNG